MNCGSLRFARTYQECRAQFQEAVITSRTRSGSSFLPTDDSLAMDWALVGRVDASKLLILTSGTHGPELPAGSYCQSQMLREGRFTNLPEDCAVLLVHAVNPWGAFYCRRNNEDNIDLCRNHLSFDNPLPTNQLYANLADAIAHCSHDNVEQFLLETVEKLGKPAVLAGLMAGQYQYPKGFSYGGSQLAWSNATLLNLLREHTQRARQTVIIDFHTGVGPYGYGSAVCMQIGDELTTAEDVFGNWVIAPRAPGNEATYYQVTGHSTEGYTRSVNASHLVNIVLEFGTYDSDTMLNVLLQQLAIKPTPSVASQFEASEWDTKVAEFFSPKDADWEQSVWLHANLVIDQALRYLAT